MYRQEQLRQNLLANAELRERLQRTLPTLTKERISDPATFATMIPSILKALAEEERQLEREKAEEIRKLEEDPLNPDHQLRIEELIREKAVLANWENAMEYHPESFGRVIMLYIPIEVNGVQLKAFVDSGAQMTIMSPDCAEKCNIMRLIDKRFAGTAVGVGTAKVTFFTFWFIPKRRLITLFNRFWEECIVHILKLDKIIYHVALV